MKILVYRFYQLYIEFIYYIALSHALLTHLALTAAMGLFLGAQSHKYLSESLESSRHLKERKELLSKGNF